MGSLSGTVRIGATEATRPNATNTFRQTMCSQESRSCELVSRRCGLIGDWHATIGKFFDKPTKAHQRHCKVMIGPSTIWIYWVEHRYVVEAVNSETCFRARDLDRDFVNMFEAETWMFATEIRDKKMLHKVQRLWGLLKARRLWTEYNVRPGQESCKIQTRDFHFFEFH